MLCSPFFTNKIICKVSLVSKTTNPVESSDYRPMSILQALSKVCKRLILLQLIEYVEKLHPLKKTGGRNGSSFNKVEIKFSKQWIKLNQTKTRTDITKIK